MKYRLIVNELEEYIIQPLISMYGCTMWDDWNNQEKFDNKEDALKRFKEIEDNMEVQRKKEHFHVLKEIGK